MISSASVDSKLVWGCVSVLNREGRGGFPKDISIDWALRHRDVKGNEAADKLVRQGSPRSFVTADASRKSPRNGGKDHQDKDRQKSS